MHHRMQPALWALTYAITLLMLLPLFQFPSPEYVTNGDVALHYKLIGLIAQDPGNIAYEIYPKLFHLLAAGAMQLSLSIWQAMVLVTAVFALLAPYGVFRLGRALTGDCRLAACAAALSSASVLFTSGLTGLAMPTPQIIALALFPLGLVLFIERRWIAAGIALGLMALAHGSWPLLAAMFILYALFQLRQPDRRGWLAGLLLALLFGLLILWPMQSFIYQNAVHDTITKLVLDTDIYITSMISLLWLPALTVPFFFPLLALLGIAAITVKRHSLGRNYYFLAVMAALIALSTQLFFLMAGGDIGGLTFIPSRMFVFLAAPFALLSAYGIMSVQNNKALIILVILLFAVLSVPAHYSWHARKAVRLGAPELEAVQALSQLGTDSTVAYNPYRYNNAEHFMIFAAGQDILDQTTGYWLLGGGDPDRSGAAYLLAAKNDAGMEAVATRTAAEKIFSNEGYDLYRLAPTGRQELTLADRLRAFSAFYNQNPQLAGAIEKELLIQVTDSEQNESACAQIEKQFSLIPCAEPDLTISGDTNALHELFSTYSISEFAFRFLRFTDSGSLQLRVNAPVKLSMPNPLGPFALSASLPDIGASATVIAAEKISVTLAAGPSQAPRLPFRFIAASLRWVLLNSPHTYPNILVGLPAAAPLLL